MLFTLLFLVAGRGIVWFAAGWRQERRSG
jgi:hypothetical protein